MNNNLEPDISIKLDDDLNGILVITCKNCNAVTKAPLAFFKDNDTVTCKCGISFHFTGDDIAAVQDSFDSLRKTLQSFG